MCGEKAPPLIVVIAVISSLDLNVKVQDKVRFELDLTREFLSVLIEHVDVVDFDFINVINFAHDSPLIATE